MIESTGSEMPVKFRFQSDGIFGEKEAVHIETEGNGGVTKFVDARHWLKPSSKPDLDDIDTEGAGISNDVDIPCPDVGGSIVIPGDCYIN